MDIITIITVSYNAFSTIERTILSVVTQAYLNIEYIIVDGGSTDGTVDIIKKYESQITNWVSEPDRGVYDAMNKGISMATGEWVNFMNSGDCFYDQNVLVDFFYKDIEKDISVLYGNTELVFEDKSKIQTKRSKFLRKYMPACHQSIFCRLCLMKEFGFDINYNYAADFRFFYIITVSKRGSKVYKNRVVASYDAANGLSSLDKYLTYKEILLASEKSYIFRSLLFYWFKIKSSIITLIDVR